METLETSPACTHVRIVRFTGTSSVAVQDALAAEEPLEIRIVFGGSNARTTRSISVTMRTPGNDAELAVGFLLTEGIVRDANHIDRIACGAANSLQSEGREFAGASKSAFPLRERDAENVVTVELAPDVEVNLPALERNFYTTSSCGVCGKASLLALGAVCPPRAENNFSISAGILYQLPERLGSVQGTFQRTGGLHAAALFDAGGRLDAMREDVGRHNAVDKLLGAALLADRIPLRDRLLLLSGRASYELLQKAVMGGIPMVASVGAPSSLAVEVARRFDITLIGFLKHDRCNAYHGADRIRLTPNLP